jgi:hypothetical protein
MTQEDINEIVRLSEQIAAVKVKRDRVDNDVLDAMGKLEKYLYIVKDNLPR